MNEANSTSINLDELRLVPDWLRENAPSPSQQYAGHSGPTEREMRPDARGPRTGQGGPNRDRRDPRAGGGGAGGGDRRRDGRRPGPGGARGGDRREERPPREDLSTMRPAAAAPVRRAARSAFRSFDGTL